MQRESQTRYLQRNKILKLLSDEEVARVSRAESEPSLTIGDDYVDLNDLDKGVQRAGASPPMHGLVPRRAVCEPTWAAIVASLPDARPAPT
jgi:hypothetical protein